MSEVYRWQDCTRELLRRVLPEAVVVLPIGAIEQHGRHLPTGTDTVVVDSVAAAAVDLAGAQCSRDLVLAPTMPFGASDHHLPFGGTLSLTVETTISVLLDLSRSVYAAGARRLLVINGHGGNRGALASAGQIASTRQDLAASHVDYWTVLLTDEPDAVAGINTPGHAGAFETGLMMHLRAALVDPTEPRNPVPPIPPSGPVSTQAQSLWRDIDGYSDDPAVATGADGRLWFESCVRTLTARIIEHAATS